MSEWDSVYIDVQILYTDQTITRILIVFQVRKMRASGLDGKTVVVVGAVTDDKRIFDVPALKVPTA